jgi:hypothetical protein
VLFLCTSKSARSIVAILNSVPDPAEAKGMPVEVQLAFKDACRMRTQRNGIFT